MKTTTTEKKLSAVSYIALQADLASREGPVSATLAHLFFQCAQVSGVRTMSEWDSLVNSAREHEVSVAEALEFGED